jgi:hypothetical protein
MPDPTPNLGLARPNFNVVTWHDEVNGNFTILDAAVAGLVNISGVWDNNLSYIVGDFVVDATDSSIWECLVSHTSAAIGIMAADRAANPTYWQLSSDIATLVGDAADSAEEAANSAAAAAASAAAAAASAGTGQGRYIDIRSFGDVEPDGDITAPLQAAIDYVASITDGGAPSILIPNTLPTTDGANGSYTLGNIVFPEANIDILIAMGGFAIFLDDGVSLELNHGNSIRGVAWHRTSPQGPVPYAAIIGSATSNPVIRLNNGTNVLENLKIVPDVGCIGIHLDGTTVPTALIHIKHCSSFGATGDPTSIPFVAENVFWVWMDDCVFGSNATYPVQFRTTIDVFQTMGLVQCRNLHLENNGVLIKSQYSDCDNMQFYDTQSENFTGGAMFNFDTSAGDAEGNGISNIDIIRPQIFDSGDPVIKAIGLGVSGITVRETAADHDVMDETSDRINGLSVHYNSVGGEFGRPPAVPSYIPAIKTEFFNALDTQLISAPRAPQWVPFTPLPIEQDPTLWDDDVDAVVTGGVQAPDGSLMAGAVTGIDGDVYLYNEEHTVNVGDWVVVGIWMQGTTDDPPTPTILTLRDWTIDDAGAEINGIPIDDETFNSGFIPVTDGSHDRITDGGWKWTWAARKLTAIGTGDLNIIWRISPAGDFANPSNYFNPCAFLIPASAGWSDGDILATLRSFKGGWPNTVVPGEVALLDHQSLKVGGVRYPPNERNVTAAGAVTVDAVSDDTIFINKTVGAATTVNLPAAATRSGAIKIVDGKLDAATNNITITPNGAETIMGLSTYVIRFNGGSVSLSPRPDGAGWYV